MLPRYAPAMFYFRFFTPLLILEHYASVL